MRKYAEIFKGFVVAFAERDDEVRPEYAGSRSAIRIDMLINQPVAGDEWTGRRFQSPTRPNPNLAPPPPSDRQLLERILAIVEQP